MGARSAAAPTEGARGRCRVRAAPSNAAHVPRAAAARQQRALPRPGAAAAARALPTDSRPPKHPPPPKMMRRQRAFLSDRDIRGRIYISPHGINCQAGGRAGDARAYVEWIAAQPEFEVRPPRPPPIGRRAEPAALAGRRPRRARPRTRAPLCGAGWRRPRRGRSRAPAPLAASCATHASNTRPAATPLPPSQRCYGFDLILSYPAPFDPPHRASTTPSGPPPATCTPSCASRSGPPSSHWPAASTDWASQTHRAARRRSTRRGGARCCAPPTS